MDSQNFEGSMGKVLLYARHCVTGKRNEGKLLKYLKRLRPYKQSQSQSSSSSGSGDQRWEVILRKKGILQAIATVLRHIGQDESTAVERNSEEEVNIRNAIVCESLSILGNAYLIDPDARIEAIKYDFTTILHRLMEHPRLLFIDGIQTRGLKCLGNICTVNSQSHSRIAAGAQAQENSWPRRTIRSGIVTSIFRIIENLKKSVKPKPPNETAPTQTTSDSPVLPTKFPLDKDELLRAAIRAIRILAEDLEAQTFLCRLNGIVITGEFLALPGVVLSEELIAEIFRALIALTSRLKIARPEVIYEIKYTGVHFLEEIVRLFGSVEDSKLISRIITCIANFSKNKEVLAVCKPKPIFDIIFKRIGTTSDSTVLEQLVTLLKELVTQDSVMQNYLLPHSAEVGSTLKILKSKSPQLENHHGFILNFYENLHGSSIPHLTSLGLVDLLQDFLRETYKECTYESVRSLIYSTDSDTCAIHSKVPGQECPFVPVYRCTSPSYLQVQKEVREYLTARRLLADSEENSPHPGRSPYHFWNNWNGNMSEDETSSGNISPSSSPPRGNMSPMSSTVGSDYDEGVGGESNIFPDNEFEFSEGEELPGSADDMTVDSYYGTPRPVKKRKLNSHSHSSPASPASAWSMDTSANASGAENSHEISIADMSDSPLTTAKVKKITAVIGILKKLMHMEPFKPELLKFTPTLLSLLFDGKVSCMNFEGPADAPSVQDESVVLPKRCFYGCDYILREFFTKIGNFQSILEAGIIPLLNRLICLGKENVETHNDELKKCNAILEHHLPTLAGENSKSTGWRQGYLMQSLLSTGNPGLKQQASIAIPLLFQTDDYSLRDFQYTGSAWTEIFNTLGNVDEISNSLFQDSIVSLATLCKTLGMKWTEREEYGRKKQLSFANANSAAGGSISMESLEIEIENVTFELDDGELVVVNKKVLTDASPVFKAMFEGSFVESEEQKVKLPNVARKSLDALIEQIVVNASDSPDSNLTDPDPTQKYDLRTVFDLLSLTNRFLLTEIQEKTFNSIMTSYLCPYSAPTIYERAVQMLPHEKPQDVQDVWTRNGASGAGAEQFDFPILVLKYLLVDPKLSCGLQCSAFKKIFDRVEPFVVIRDLKALFEHYSKARVAPLTPSPRRKFNNGNIMLKS